MEQERDRVELTVEFMAQARQLSGTDETRLALPGAATPAALGHALLAAHPALAALLGDGDLRGGLLLFVDRQQVDWDDERPLAAGQEILVAAAMSGG